MLLTTIRIQPLQHCRSLIIASLALVPNYRQFMQFQFSVYTLLISRFNGHEPPSVP